MDNLKRILKIFIPLLVLIFPYQTNSTLLSKQSIEDRATGLRAALVDPYPSVRSLALKAIGKMADQASHAASKLHSEDTSETSTNLKRNAMLSIALDKGESVKLLVLDVVEMLKDKDADVRKSAIRTLISSVGCIWTPQGLQL